MLRHGHDRFGGRAAETHSHRTGRALLFNHYTQDCAADGWVYCCAVIDAHSRRVVGRSVAGQVRTELFVDGLQLGRRQRRPQPATIAHADRRTQYTSWLFGHPLHAASPLGSMGRVACSVDNALVESLSSTMQRELLA